MALPCRKRGEDSVDLGEDTIVKNVDGIIGCYGYPGKRRMHILSDARLSKSNAALHGRNRNKLFRGWSYEGGVSGCLRIWQAEKVARRKTGWSRRCVCVQLLPSFDPSRTSLVLGLRAMLPCKSASCPVHRAWAGVFVCLVGPTILERCACLCIFFIYAFLSIYIICNIT